MEKNKLLLLPIKEIVKILFYFFCFHFFLKGLLFKDYKINQQRFHECNCENLRINIYCINSTKFINHKYISQASY